MGDNFSWNREGLNNVISDLKTRKSNLQSQKESLNTLKNKISTVWSGNEHDRADEKIKSAATELEKAIATIDEQIVYLEKKNARYEENRMRL